MNIQEAIIELNHKQFYIYPKQYIITDHINLPIGQLITCKHVLMIKSLSESNILFGNPYLTQYKVILIINNHLKGKKIKIIKFRRRKHYKKQLGYRSKLTELLVKNIIKL